MAIGAAAARAAPRALAASAVRARVCCRCAVSAAQYAFERDEMQAKFDAAMAEKQAVRPPAAAGKGRPGVVATVHAAAEVAEADIKEVFKTVGAIALLGGVEFAKKGEKTLVAPGSEGALATVSSLLGVAGESLRAALCIFDVPS